MSDPSTSHSRIRYHRKQHATRPCQSPSPIACYRALLPACLLVSGLLQRGEALGLDLLALGLVRGAFRVGLLEVGLARPVVISDCG